MRKYVTIDWIESHQDDNPNIVLLISVQLNIHTDELTTIGLNNLPPKPHIHLDPLVKIQLNFYGGIITRNIPSFLQERLLLPPLHQQYVERFSWTTNEFDDIDWDIFRPVYKKWAKKKLDWTHKFSTRNLACGARLAKQGTTDPIEYKSCGLPIENDDHLFQCLKQPQFIRRIQLIVNDVPDILNLKLYHLLKHHLTAYIQGKVLSC